jgi:hypothetical protein
MNRTLRLCAALSLFMVIFAGGAQAQATRTWVSGVGDDVNPCSRTAPCKTFAGAISKTAASGEINVLDPGGFGAVTITKSISIIAEGNTAGIVASGSNGIVINGNANTRVHLEGLDIEGVGESALPGQNGVRILNAGTVILKNVNIRGFRPLSAGIGNGVDVQSLSPVRVYVMDSILSGNLTGINVKNAAVVNQVFVDNSQLLDNVNVSLNVDGAKARAFIDNSILRGATTDLNVLNAGRINSYYNNHVGTGTPSNPTPLEFQ